MRNVIAILVIALATWDHAIAAKSAINLDRSGALETLKSANPAHFERVTSILQAATEMPCHIDEFARVMRAKFEAKDANCGVTLQTSDPAKRRLKFTLDDTEYMSVIRMKQDERLIPVK